MGIKSARATAGAAMMLFVCFAGVRSVDAVADCHLAAPTVIMCQSPRSAVDAFQAFQFDTEKMNASYNKQILHEAWCALVSDPRNKFSFETYSVGRVATPNGWVNVVQIGFEHDGLDDVRYVASRYIAGECRKYQYDPNRSPSEGSGARSPYLPSAPAGGYKSDPSLEKMWQTPPQIDDRRPAR